MFSGFSFTKSLLSIDNSRNTEFQRNFVLAEGIEVEGASMENGLLSVDLSQPINSEESKKIEIKDTSKKENEKLISLENGKSNRQK